MSTHAERLSTLRESMRAQQLDCVIVRGTDRYLNEYVPTDESTRVWLTGFSGSVGDALITPDAAWIFVDGRYDQQAAKETDAASWTVVKVLLGQAIERAWSDRIVQLGSRAPTRELRVSYEPDRFSMEMFDLVTHWVQLSRVVWVGSQPSLLESARGDVRRTPGVVRAVAEDAVGRRVSEKITILAEFLHAEGADAMLVQRLDELAYLSNLRGNELPYQATFRAVGVVTRKELRIATDGAEIPEAVRSARPDIRWVAGAGLFAGLAEGTQPVIVVDPTGTTVSMRKTIEDSGIKTLSRPSPLTSMKAKKTPAELHVMQRAFQRADTVVAEAQRWLIGEVVGGNRVSETAFAQKVEEMFVASGAVGLSFRVIAACGENAAVAHHPSDPERMIRRGEMMLLDTGAYYLEGYATDLTRTFFVGGPGDVPTAEMKRWFTLTLKAAIAGMTARVPRGANGAQLDGIVRQALWSHGFEYSHGTGHGVGINVHEAPPRVASVSSNMQFEEGHVFSIEPGVYVPGRGGVRIENLCTVVPDSEVPEFLRVESMTFSPLDGRLIESTMLTDLETEFLATFAKGYKPFDPTSAPSTP